MKQIFISLVTILGLISCGSNPKSNADFVAPPQLVMPELPSLIDQQQAPAWMTEHFWDEMNPADTSFKVYKNNLEEIMKVWSEVMTKVHPNIVYNGVKNAMNKMKDDSTALSNFMFAAEKAFYDPYAPKRNFEAYIAVVEYIVASDKFSDIDKARPLSQLNMLNQNRFGNKANNFSFITLDNKKYNLYDVQGPFVLLFFNNPDCPTCAEYKEILSQNAGLNLSVNNNTVQVIGVVVDSDAEQHWREKAVNFPVNWVNGFNKEGEIKSQKLYDVTVIPTLILLDKEKNVIFKDPHPYELLEFLSQIR